MGKLFEKVILKTLQKHIDERGLLNASQFGFRARHSTTLQCMRLKDQFTLNFNNKISTAAVFLDIEKAFDTTWHSGLLYNLSKLEFSTSLIKLIGSVFSQRKFRVSAAGEMSTPRVMQAGVPQGSVLSPTLFNMYINGTPQTHGVHLASLQMTPACMRQIPRKVLLLENFSAFSAQWRPDVSVGISRLKRIRLGWIYFSRSRRPPEHHLTLNGRDIPFVNSVKYLGVFFIRKLQRDYI
jgi:hypothetical protein